MKKGCLIAASIVFPGLLAAQMRGFSEGKGLGEIQARVYGKSKSYSFERSEGFKPSERFKLSESCAPSPVFLPKWSAEDLPFFCKVEHNWAKKARFRLPLKFRLGSVEYVDWLEGKGD